MGQQKQSGCGDWAGGECVGRRRIGRGVVGWRVLPGWGFYVPTLVHRSGIVQQWLIIDCHHD